MFQLTVLLNQPLSRGWTVGPLFPGSAVVQRAIRHLKDLDDLQSHAAGGLRFLAARNTVQEVLALNAQRLAAAADAGYEYVTITVASLTDSYDIRQATEPFLRLHQDVILGKLIHIPSCASVSRYPTIAKRAAILATLAARYLVGPVRWSSVVGSVAVRKAKSRYPARGRVE